MPTISSPRSIGSGTRQPISISRCWSTACRRSASRASPSTSPTAISRRRGGASSSPTRRATSSTRATWRRAPRPPTSRSSWSTRRKGLLPQTRRHSAIVALMGIRHIVLAVNKMDLVGYREDALRRDRRRLSRRSPRQLGLSDVTAIPVSALHGDNVIAAERGDAVVPRTDAARPSRDRRRRADASDQPFRLAGAMGQPPDAGFRGYRRHGRWAAASVPATRSSSCRRACGRALPASSPTMATSTARWRARRSR